MNELDAREERRSIMRGQVLPEGQFDRRFPYGVPPSGVLCPWNKTDKGPAKKRIWCYVWRDTADFDQWAVDGNFHFCRAVCHYGHMTAEQRARAGLARKGFAIRKKMRDSWMRRWQSIKPKLPPVGGSRF